MMEIMGWNMELTERDISFLEQFLSIMTPFQDLVDKLGGEKCSTIHLVYPSLKELFALLDEKISKREAPGFCKDLKEEMKKYFKFVLDANFSDFNPLYIAATYLDPFYKLTLDEEMTEIAKDFILELVKEEQNDLNDNIRVVENKEKDVNLEQPKFVLPGFSRLSENILKKSQGDADVGSNSVETVHSALEKDFKLYDLRAKVVFCKAVNEAEKRHKKVQDQSNDGTTAGGGSDTTSHDLTEKNSFQSVGASGARANEDAERDVEATVKPKDPLDFWIAQVVIILKAKTLLILFILQEKSKEYFTVLPTVAQDLMAIPATSVPSERTFNISGLLSDNKMSGIFPDNLEKRVIIKCNPHLN